jgi:tRNA pseudouridine65 synthase
MIFPSAFVVSTFLFLSRSRVRVHHGEERRSAITCVPFPFFLSSTSLSLGIENKIHGINNSTSEANSNGFDLSGATSIATVDSVDNPRKGPKWHPKKDRPRLPILCYQDRWVCVNKPAGMSTHRSGGNRSNQFVVSTLLKRQLSRKVFPVHRLDHRTSGALLFAFDSEMCASLHDALREQSARKTYVCLVRGFWDNFFESDTATVDKALTVDGTKRSATTVFTKLASTIILNNSAYGEKNVPISCSLILAVPTTGRTHQIRRHASAMGMPVLGDTQHGETKVNRWWRQKRGLDRLALHCLSLNLPTLVGDLESDGGSRLRVVAPLPENLKSVLEQNGLKELWEKALQKEPNLASAWIDERGGTLGRKKIWQLAPSPLPDQSPDIC